MFSAKIVLVAFIAWTAVVKASRIQPCYKHDVSCIGTSVSLVINGLPEHGIPSSDRVVIPEMKVGDCGLTLKNVVVSGFGSHRVTDFQIQHNSNFLMESESPLTIHADVEMESQFPWHNPLYPIIHKVYRGRFTAKANVKGRLQWSFAVRRARDGLEYFTFGREDVVGAVSGQPEASLKFDEELVFDPVQGDHSSWPSSISELNDIIIRNVFQKSYAIVFGSGRAIGTALPKSTFFKDL